MSLAAVLVEDAGRAASGPDFFRSVEFLAAEKATHSLLIHEPDDPTALIASAPLLVRDIPGSGRRDAISPYGYPGFAISDGPQFNFEFPIDPATIDFSSTGLVTIFVRHALGGPPPLTGATPRNVCLLSDPDLPRKSRASDRQQIRKNLKLGHTVEITPGPETSIEQKAEFFAAYTETMVRTGAARRYFFSESYFKRILSAEGTWLFICRNAEGQAAAASIAVLSDRLLHYYLSGTADAHLKGAPMKNLLEEMIGFGAERELAVNFGGGIVPGDALEEFKRGFANREEQWFTSELVCDPAADVELTESLAPGADPGFFPSYRA
ncbi:MAG: GNAT family N-acetyltransferase [Solirubrobacterales bacterium]|nr:GNAT family N-acetyltransferase [Solirubrobacterales bacterium]